MAIIKKTLWLLGVMALELLAIAVVFVVYALTA